MQEYADFNDITFWEALVNAKDIDTIKNAALSKLEPFVDLIGRLRAKEEFMSLKELAEAVIEDISRAFHRMKRWKRLRQDARIWMNSLIR